MPEFLRFLSQQPLVVLLVWALTFIGCGDSSNKTSQTIPAPAPGTPPPSGGTTSSGGSTGSGTTTGSTTGSTTGGSTAGGTTTGGSTGSSTGGSTGGSGSTGSGTGSTGGSSGGSGSGTGGGTSGGGTTGSGGSHSISGTIVDAESNAPIDGTVNVLLEGSGGGDAQVLMQTTADAQGRFQFDDVSQNVSAIMTSAVGSDGTFYTPALLVAGNGSCSSCGANTAAGGDPIVPGTDIGTIPLQHSSTTGFMAGTVSSSDKGNNNPTAVRVTVNLMTTFVLDRSFPVALAFPPQEFKTDTADETCGDGHGACAAYTFKVPTDRFQEAVYNHNGYNFSPRNEFTNYKPIFNAFSIDTGEPDCNPSTIRGGFGATFGPFVSPSGTAIVATNKFENCQ